MTPPYEVSWIDSSGSSLQISRCCSNGRVLWLPALSSLSPRSSIHSLVPIGSGWNKHVANAWTAAQSNIFSPPGMSGSSKELWNYLEQTTWSCCPWWPSSRVRLDDISVCEENCLPRRAALGGMKGLLLRSESEPERIWICMLTNLQQEGATRAKGTEERESGH